MIGIRIYSSHRSILVLARRSDVVVLPIVDR